MEYSSAIRQNEIVLFVGKWMELEIMMLNEVSQGQKTNVTCFHSYAESSPKK
jgi:hypothetical protein